MQSGEMKAQPLSGFSKWVLAVGAGAVIALFYLFVLVSVLALLLVIALEFCLVLAVARLGLLLFVRPLRRDIAMLLVFLRSLRLRKESEAHIALQPEEAPGLFAVLQKLCPRAGMALPHEVLLLMNVNAWVRLKGYRRGAGKTFLAVGYDLLAGFSTLEVEAVLAHELMHAKLVQRGLKTVLNGGLVRAASLSRSLAAQVEACRRARQPAGLARLLVKAADALTRQAATWIAACSRQDEFEADLGSVELCGAGPVRLALSKVESLGRITAKLPWRERVAHIQMGELSQWLVSELVAAQAAGVPEEKKDLFNRYSTHPSIRDRLAALPPAPVESSPAGPSGLSLLTEPDAIAAKLLSKIERVVAEQEQKDSEALEKWSRKTRGGTHLRPVQLLGLLFFMISFAAGLTGLIAGVHKLRLALCGAVGAVGAVFIYRCGAYKERLALPVPDFAVLKAAWQSKITADDNRTKAIEAELRAAAPAGGKSLPATYFASASYDALGQCDYLRAHAAARLCLKADAKSAPGALALAIASAVFGQRAQVARFLASAQKCTGLKGASTAWGLGWALLLCGEWGRAEAFLAQAVKTRPQQATWLSLLALCQSRRGKLQSAILSARRACTPAPPNKEHAKLLIDLLLECGYLREANERLAPWRSEIRNDQEFTLSAIRLHLLLREFQQAAEWTEAYTASAPTHMLVRLGLTYEMARQGTKAAEYYHQALAAGHYPEALLGLARLDAERGDKEQARRHVLAALNLKCALAEKATGPLPLFQSVLRQLLNLEEPALNCQAWIASMSRQTLPAAAANKSFLVYAPAGQEPAKWL
ncbi:MAG TPA: M48 family metalloprotease, partial [Verrucomicrobiae bacterium]|nr:M48 family metalloprotease [Verrucomicrobiae bacterium]